MAHTDTVRPDGLRAEQRTFPRNIQLTEHRERAMERFEDNINNKASRGAPGPGRLISDNV